jgi:long-chain fatty acid transport protein
MKRFVVFLSVVCAVFCVASSLMAGGIDNRSNYSADYIRSLNRNAAIDSADMVIYNPAGVMRMEDGTYMKLDAQYTAVKDVTNTIGGTGFESDATDAVPLFVALHRKDQWAAFAAFSIPAGGGTVEFEQGNATSYGIGMGVIAGSGGFYSTISDQYIKGKSVYYGYAVGGAYAFNDMVSVSLAARYVNAEKEANGFVTVAGLAPTATFSVDYEQDDGGLGFILGANFTPSEDWNIGVRYESETSLDLEYTVNRDDLDDLILGGVLPPSGSVESRNLPAILALGVAHKVSPKVRVEADLTYYLQEDADWSDSRFLNTVDDGYELGITLEYTFSPKLKGSVGYLMTETGLDPDGLLYEYPELDANTFGFGIAYEINPKWTLNAGLAKSFYSDETTSSDITLEKDVVLMAVGIQYKLW